MSTLKLLVGGCPPYNSKEEGKLERKVKKRKEKQRKIVKFSIGSKQMSQKLMGFEWGT